MPDRLTDCQNTHKRTHHHERASSFSLRAREDEKMNACMYDAYVLSVSAASESPARRIQNVHPVQTLHTKRAGWLVLFFRPFTSPTNYDMQTPNTTTRPTSLTWTKNENEPPSAYHSMYVRTHARVFSRNENTGRCTSKRSYADGEPGVVL